MAWGCSPRQVHLTTRRSKSTAWGAAWLGHLRQGQNQTAPYCLSWCSLTLTFDLIVENTTTVVNHQPGDESNTHWKRCFLCMKGVWYYMFQTCLFSVMLLFSFYTFLQTKQSEPAYYATQSAFFHFWLLVVVHWKKKRVLIVVACAWCWELLFCLNWPPWHVVLWLRWWKINAFTLF